MDRYKPSTWIYPSRTYVWIDPGRQRCLPHSRIYTTRTRHETTLTHLPHTTPHKQSGLLTVTFGCGFAGDKTKVLCHTTPHHTRLLMHMFYYESTRSSISPYDPQSSIVNAIHLTQAHHTRARMWHAHTLQISSMHHYRMSHVPHIQTAYATRTYSLARHTCTQAAHT